MPTSSRTRAIVGSAETMNPFMCIGDSITVGFGPTPDTGGYRTKLQALCRIPLVLTGRNVNPASVPTSMDEGYNGQRCDQVLPTVLPMMPILQPRNLIVCLGVNDMNQGETAAATLTEVHSACNSLLAAGDPYIQHVFVLNVPLGSTEQTIGGPAYNSGMAAEYAGADSRIIVVDAWSTLTPGPSSDFSDGLHPTDAGYQKGAAAIYAALQAVYPQL